MAELIEDPNMYYTLGYNPGEKFIGMNFPRLKNTDVTSTLGIYENLDTTDDIRPIAVTPWKHKKTNKTTEPVKTMKRYQHLVDEQIENELEDGYEDWQDMDFDNSEMVPYTDNKAQIPTTTTTTKKKKVSARNKKFMNIMDKLKEKYIDWEIPEEETTQDDYQTKREISWSEETINNSDFTDQYDESVDNPDKNDLYGIETKHLEETVKIVKQQKRKLGTFVDLVKARNPQYNDNENNDAEWMQSGNYVLLGSPVIKNPDSNELLVVSNIYAPGLKDLEEVISNMSLYRENDTNNIGISTEFYEQIKHSGSATIISKEDIKLLESGSVSEKEEDLRRRIIHSLFQQDLDLIEDYIDVEYKLIEEDNPDRAQLIGAEDFEDINKFLGISHYFTQKIEGINFLQIDPQPYCYINTRIQPLTGISSIITVKQENSEQTTRNVQPITSANDEEMSDVMKELEGSTEPREEKQENDSKYNIGFGKLQRVAKEIIEEGKAFGNLADLIEARRYNYKESDDYNDNRKFIKEGHPLLIGNPILFDPEGTGDQLIINDIYHEDLTEFRKNLFEQLTSDSKEKTTLNISSEMYNQIKQSDAAFNLSCEESESIQSYDYKKDYRITRQEILSHLLKQDNELITEYLLTEEDGLNAEKSFNYYIKELKGVTFLYASPGNYQNTTSLTYENNPLVDCHFTLTIGQTAQPNNEVSA